MKYPSTPYFSHSPSKEAGDRVRDSLLARPMIHQPLIFTIKMDGSNVSIYHDHVAARNGINANHKSFSPLKAMQVQQVVPENIVLFGEWLFAEHSIHYEDLESYLMIFGMYDLETDRYQSWKTVTDFCNENGLITVPVVHEATYVDAAQLFADVRKIGNEVIANGHEGLVVRAAQDFHKNVFESQIAKYVRANHVQTDQHWKFKEIVKNGCRSRD